MPNKKSAKPKAKKASMKKKNTDGLAKRAATAMQKRKKFLDSI